MPLQADANRLTSSFDLGRVHTWIFDIDNTLYPAQCDLFSQIHIRMAEFVANTLSIDLEAAKSVRRDFFLRYGTTMRGLMEEHGVDPNEYMAYVHDVDYSPVKKDDALRTLIQSLPGRKLVFTNASLEHGVKCAQQLGVEDLFEGWFDIRDADFEPKPDMRTYEKFTAKFDVAPSGAIFFEDTLKNLESAKLLGWQTAYIDPAIDLSDPATPPAFANVGYVDAHGAGLHEFFDAHWQK